MRCARTNRPAVTNRSMLPCLEKSSSRARSSRNPLLHLCAMKLRPRQGEALPYPGMGAKCIAMSTTFQLDTSTSRATPTPKPRKRLTVPRIRDHKKDGATKEPLVMLTAYTARQAQLLDAHCDILLVGDSLGQVIYGLDSTLPVTPEMMINHGAAVVRGSYHSLVVVDMPFGSYEASPQQAFCLLYTSPSPRDS